MYFTQGQSTVPGPTVGAMAKLSIQAETGGAVAFALATTALGGLGAPHVFWIATLVVALALGALALAGTVTLQRRWPSLARLPLVADRRADVLRIPLVPDPRVSLALAAAGPHPFPVRFQFEGYQQDDEFEPRNTRLTLHLRAVNRTRSNASLILHLGIKDPNKPGFRMWQQARTPGSHPLAILSPQGRDEPSHVPAEKAEKLEPEFLFAKEYVEDIRKMPPKGRDLGMIESEYLWLRAKDLISGESVEKPLSRLNEL